MATGQMTFHVIRTIFDILNEIAVLTEARMIDGQGVMEYPSGDRYEGGWKAGQRSGHVFILPSLINGWSLTLSFFRAFFAMPIAMSMMATGRRTSYGPRISVYLHVHF